jgi:phosphonate transport system substrate-binding protein
MISRKVLFYCLFTSILFAQEITLGVVPQQSPLELSKKWLKITNYLHEKTGIKVVFKTEKSIQLFEEKFVEGQYDIAFMNPYHFIVANKQQNYNAFARSKNDIVGIILGKKGKEFNVNNLKGTKFLFPSPNAFAATLLTKYELKEKYNFDIDKEAKVIYVNSHDSVYKGIAREIGDFGGGINRTFNNFKDQEDKDKIEIVYKTKPYPSHPFASHPRVSKEIVEKILKAIIEMPDELKEILSIKDFIPTSTSEYDVIKNLEINK